MSKSLAELNQIATEISQAIGYCSQELLLEIHAKLKEASATPVVAEAPKSDA